MEAKDTSQDRESATFLEDSRRRGIAMEAASVGTWEVHLDTNTVSWDARCRALFGLHAATSIPYDQVLKYIHPADLNAVNTAVKNAVSGLNNGKYDIHYRTIGADDGTLRWVHFTGQAYFNEKNEAITFAGIAQDITASSSSIEQTIEKLWSEKNPIPVQLNNSAQDSIHLRSLQLALEQEIQKRTSELDISNEELRASVEELNVTNEELAELNKELKQSNEDLQQFAHVASHDLKEPLRKIKTFISRLEEDADTHLSTKSTAYIDKMYHASDRMFSMIDGVLTYSTINGSKQAIQNIDLNRIIVDIANDLEVLITQKHAIIRYKALPNIEGASVLIYQLFYNLITNSLKFSRPNAFPLIKIESVLMYEDDQHYVEIELSDNGIGFDHEEANVIFNTFTRLHSKDKYEGTGLGLSLCKKIVQRHKGTICAEGTLAKGATFIITLPLRQQQEHI